MSPDERADWRLDRPTGRPTRVARALITAVSAEALVLILLGLAMFAVLATGRALGLW
ncbi:hypothetical protein [Natrinema saccharevitans]|uniref:hypothetical protein n=1 Tax=Natrinema saccharevitans TaxID=301967 RepID=UPI00158D9856|nr:hypothetical protein [Natrinema saccharevitans]